MRALRTFSHPMARSRLPQSLRLLLLNLLLLPSLSTLKLKSQRVRMIRTEILPQALEKLLRLSLQSPKNNNLQWLLKTLMHNRPSLKINRFRRELSPKLALSVLNRSHNPNSRQTNSHL